jgi:hypothetical protein
MVEVTRLAEVIHEVAGVAAAPPASGTAIPPVVLAGATVNTTAYLRDGPGAHFAVVGSALPGQPLDLVARSADGGWYQLAGGSWIAAFRVENAPAALPEAAVMLRASTPSPIPLPSPTAVPPFRLAAVSSVCTPEVQRRFAVLGYTRWHMDPSGYSSFHPHALVSVSLLCPADQPGGVMVFRAGQRKVDTAVWAATMKMAQAVMQVAWPEFSSWFMEQSVEALAQGEHDATVTHGGTTVRFSRNREATAITFWRAP